MTVRLIYTDAPEKVMQEHKGKILAVIGPFESFSDAPRLQGLLESLLKAYNSSVKWFGK